MMTDAVVFYYFLRKKQWDFFVYNEKKHVTVDKVRHFDAGFSWHNAIIVTDSRKDAREAAKDETDLVLYVCAGDQACDGRGGNDDAELCVSGSAATGELMPEAPVLIVKTKKKYQLINDIQEIFDTMNRWQQQLGIISGSGHDYQKLTDCCDALIEEPFSLIDKDFYYIAYSKEMSEKLGYVSERVENGRLSMKFASQLMSTPGFENLEKEQDVFDFEDDYHFIGKNIFFEGRYTGRLVMMHNDDAWTDGYHRYILKVFSEFVTHMYQREGSFYINEIRQMKMHLIIKGVLEGENVTDNLWVQALEEKGWHEGDAYTVMVLDTTYRHEKRLYAGYLGPQIENMWHFTAAVAWSGKVAVLINKSSESKNFVQQFPCFIRDNLLTAGISRQFLSYKKIKTAFLQAQTAMKYGRIKAPHLWYYFFDDYGADYLMKQCTLSMDAESVCHPALLWLMDYDKAHGTQMYASLYAYIKCRFNMAAAAGEMYVHRTTFIKRMEKILKMTGICLDDWKTVMYLMLSYSLMAEKAVQENNK